MVVQDALLWTKGTDTQHQCLSPRSYIPSRLKEEWITQEVETH